MKSMLRQVQHGTIQYSCLAFICPGCAMDDRGTGLHMLPVNTNQKKPSWTWDENLEAPTISPSILTRGGTDEKPFVCHSFLKEGIFQFLDDCTHSLKGLFIPISDLPDWIVREGS